MGFRLVSISVTLNGVIAFISPNLIALQANYVTVVEHRLYNVHKISSPSYILAKTDPHSSCIVSLRPLSFSFS